MIRLYFLNGLCRKDDDIDESRPKIRLMSQGLKTVLTLDNNSPEALQNAPVPL